MNKDKKLFKSPIQMIIYLIVFVLLIAAFIMLGSQNFKKEELSDQEKFDADFSLVGSNNVYAYANNVEVRMLINKGNAIIFFGTNQSEWTQYYAKILNDVALSCGVDKIYYYDFVSDRKEGNATYQSIVEKLAGYVKTNDLGKKDIYAPSLLIIKNGEILLFDDETSFVVGSTNPTQYWTEEKLLEKQTVLQDALYDYLGVELSGE
jgi:hypothetical protein